MLRTYLAPQWPRMLLLSALLLATTALQVLNPQLLRLFIDAAVAGISGTAGVDVAGAQDPVAAQTERALFIAALSFLGVGLVNQLLSAFATYVSNDLGWAATNRLRADLALHCLRLDMTFHNARTPGEMIERIDGDVNALANFFSAFSIRIVGSLLLLAGVIVMLWREDARVAMLLGAFSLLIFFAMRALQSRGAGPSRAEREASAKLFGFLEERLTGIDDIRANGAGDYVMQRFYAVSRTLFHTGRRAWMTRAVMWLVTMSLFGVANAVALGLGYQLFSAGSVTLGTVYLISHYTGMLVGPLERISQELQDLQRATASLDRVQELYHIRSSLPEAAAEHAVSLPHGPLAVEFDSVSFTYPDAARNAAGGVAEPVLENVSFHLAAGRTLGLLGRTGSGKTTATRLLFRLFDVTQGAIRIGGVDVREPQLNQLRERVAVVTQDVQLFSGTVRENLTFFDSSIPDERILAVLEDLGLLPWYSQLPDGLDTVLGPGGRGLSAGEAQLLAFTRAFLADPSVVVLDEASSRLDPATEQLIERAVAKLLRDRTGLIIAHRLGTVERADEILVLEDGRVREHGQRASLAGDPDSRYAGLLRTGLSEVLV